MEVRKTIHYLFLAIFGIFGEHDVIYSRESDEILSLINQFKEVYYLPGNHDHITLDAAQNYPDFNCYSISKYFRIRSRETNFFLVHGHELEVISELTYLTIDEYDKISDQLCRMNDTEGNIASYLWLPKGLMCGACIAPKFVVVQSEACINNPFLGSLSRGNHHL